MKMFRSARLPRFVTCWVSAAACCLPSILFAHPGHYHPDETDEFDFLRATFFHSHGTLDYILAAVVISSLALACLHGKFAVRAGALAAALGSIGLLAIS